MSHEPSPSATPALSRRKIWVFRGITLLLVFLCLEVFGWVGLRLLNRRYPMDPMAEITSEMVESYLSKRYDPDLGWRPVDSKVNSIGARSAHEYEAFDGAISVYGDSYTFCDGVPVEDAWPTQLEVRAGRSVLNFGVGGYGTDQALLRLEKNYAAAPASTVLLCIQPENINRCVNIYRGFYQCGFSPPKPRFVLEGDGLRLYNPFTTPEAVRDMLIAHPEKLVAAGREYDYWCQRMMFLGQPWRIGFPYSLQLAARIPLVIDRAHTAATDLASHVPLFAPGTETLELMERIVRRFRTFGSERGFRAYVVILPPPRDVYRMIGTGELTYQPLHDFLAQEQIPFVDVIEEFAGHPDPPALMVNRKDHISRAGGALVAEEVLKFLRAQGALPAEPDAPGSLDGPN